MVQNNHEFSPDFIFEASWEVCNMVGGIYTVLSSKAKTMQEIYKGNVLFIGPDIWQVRANPWFEEDDSLLQDWRTYAFKNNKLSIRAGYWKVPGKPVAILVEFHQFYLFKNEIYSGMWRKYGVDSLHAYGDYDEACMFAYATGLTIENYYTFHNMQDKNVVAHFDEWMLGMGELYLKDKLPGIATVFTTHATTVGRSIAGNGKPLYNYLSSYNGDQMARELNVEAKHSLEKIAAREADCFTTVSDITAQECLHLLDCHAEVTPNGFEKDFIPVGKKYQQKRIIARNALINVSEKLFGVEVEEDALLVVTSGRYEYRNKGLDVFIDALGRLNKIQQLNKDVIAFIMVPAWTEEVRKDLQARLQNDTKYNSPLEYPFITHYLHDMAHDPVVNQLKYLGLDRPDNNKVKVVFVPSYLNGSDGIFNMAYYDLLIGMDISVFPSYYEPWGYTPHESIAFAVPAITTTLSGFGLWMKKMGDRRGMDDGAEVIQRDDDNFLEVSEEICAMLLEMASKSQEQEEKLRNLALERAALAGWSHFFKYYEEVYRKALHKANNRFLN